jgi:hypothetical protein
VPRFLSVLARHSHRLRAGGVTPEPSLLARRAGRRRFRCAIDAPKSGASMAAHISAIDVMTCGWRITKWVDFGRFLSNAVFSVTRL